jgi:hypothetical protein
MSNAIKGVHQLEVLKLYRSMLRNASRFQSFNFRKYFVRRIQEDFRKNRDLTDETKILQCIQKAKENDAVLRRQSSINSMYATDDIVLNSKPNKERNVEWGEKQSLCLNSMVYWLLVWLSLSTQILNWVVDWFLRYSAPIVSSGRQVTVRIESKINLITNLELFDLLLALFCFDAEFSCCNFGVKCWMRRHCIN